MRPGIPLGIITVGHVYAVTLNLDIKTRLSVYYQVIRLHVFVS